MCFAHRFFHLFSFPLTISFEEKKLFVLMKPNLSICSFMDHVLGAVFKKSFFNPRSQRFSSVFSSRSFIIIGFTFRSMIHFELILYRMQGMNFWFWLIFAYYPRTICWKDFFLRYQRPLHLCVISVVNVCVVLFLDSLYCSIDLFVYL